MRPEIAELRIALAEHLERERVLVKRILALAPITEEKAIPLKEIFGEHDKLIKPFIL